MPSDPSRENPQREDSLVRKIIIVVIATLLFFAYFFWAYITSAEGAKIQIATTKKAMSAIVSEETYNHAFQNVVNCQGSAPCGVGTLASQRAALFLESARESGADAYAPKQ